MSEADSEYWIHIDSMLENSAAPTAPKTAPSGPSSPALPATGPRSRSTGHAREIRLLVVLSLFLLDTFLPWQRACVGFGAFGFRFGGCLTANAWSGTAAHAGQAAGVFAILAIGLIGARINRIDLGEGGRFATRVCVYGAALAGILKWIAVAVRIPGPGAWLGLLLLLAIGILESVDRLKIR